MNQFNITRFRQLVEKEKTFEKIVKSFSDESSEENKFVQKIKIFEKTTKLFKNESPDEYAELFSYREMIRDQCCSQNRWKYFNLINDYEEKTIDDSSFGILISYTYHDDSETATRLEKDLEELATFSIDPRSKGFSNRIYQISDLCYEMEDLLDLDDDEMSLEEFRLKVNESENKLKKMFSELQPYFYFQDNSKSITDFKDLGEKSLFFDANVGDRQITFVIDYKKTKNHWYQYTNYLEYGCHIPSCLPAFGTNDYYLNQEKKKDYKKDLTTEDVNSIRYGIKNFCRHFNTEIISNGTMHKNGRQSDVEKNDPNARKIVNGTFFINKKTRKFVFFKENTNSNSYYTGWAKHSNERGNECSDDIIKNHNAL